MNASSSSALQAFSARFHGLAPDRRQHVRRLLPAHYADAGIGPHPQEARRVGPPAHPVVAGAEAAADDHGDLRDFCAGDRGDELGAVLGDAFAFIFPADHEAADVLQEQQGDPELAGKFDEMRALQRRSAEQDAVVGENRDRDSPRCGRSRTPGSFHRAP